jgi:hypothetical protein
LIICGYGFGDKGINSRIINWRHSHRDNTIVIIRRDCPFDESARIAIHNNLADWANDPTVIHLNANAESATWSDIRRAIAAAP